MAGDILRQAWPTDRWTELKPSIEVCPIVYGPINALFNRRMTDDDKVGLSASAIGEPTMVYFAQQTLVPSRFIMSGSLSGLGGGERPSRILISFEKAHPRFRNREQVREWGPRP